MFTGKYKRLSLIVASASLLALAIVASFSPAYAQFSTKPQPLWEGTEKSEADLKNDQEFIKNATELAEGDRELAARSLVQLGWKRLGSGDANHAIRAFNQASLLKPDFPDIYWGFAIATHIRGDELENITRWFDKTRELMKRQNIPESPRIEADQGRILEERKLPAEARPFFEKALSLDENYVIAHIGMIRVASALGDDALREKHQNIHDELTKAKTE